MADFQMGAGGDIDELRSQGQDAVIAETKSLTEVFPVPVRPITLNEASC